jgi:inhibitor of the pro-sigma K processing machinery
MDYLWVGAGIVVLWLLNKIILAPVRRLIVNVVVGLIALYFVNHFGAAIGLALVPITWLTGLIIGVFGLPAVVVLTLYYTFI